MSEDFIGFGTNDKAIVEGGQAEKYKGTLNHTDRIAIVWLFKDKAGEYQFDTTPKFKAVSYHYAQGLGYFLSKGDYTTNTFGPPKKKVGTFVVQYKTDKKGALPKDKEGKPILDFEVKEWGFGEDKYRQLAAIHEEFSLAKHDIKVNCTDEQYQKLTFTACNNTALWQRDPAMKEAVLARVAEMSPHLSLARDLSVEDIKKLQGGGSGSAVAATNTVASDVDYDDMMDDIE